jgi:hypothetical protein
MARFSLVLSRKRLKLATRDPLGVPLLCLLEVDDVPNSVQVLYTGKQFDR